MLFYPNKTFYDIFKYTVGLGLTNKVLLTNRLELKSSAKVNKTFILDFKNYYNKDLINLLNRYYSQINSVNNRLLDLTKFNIVRLYLIKTYRGRCHVLGKPVNGQRT